ncbi:Up in starvation [Mortierella claussenii]|nr:Up in starvation [Mortierella claussenii]
MSARSSTRESPALNKSAAPSVATNTKGKLFQCTGFGDCRMVFTRSEHLARHARKHTGEKPFQCVVDGCTRMFSRFDNMVQHTQTHTKGPRRESAAGIASKIEMRRKSEAVLFVSPPPRAAGKAAKSNRRSSTFSTSGGDVAQDTVGGAMRKSRVNSMTDVADAASVKGRERDGGAVENGLSASFESTFPSAARSAKDKSKVRKKNQNSTTSLLPIRRRSLGSSTSTSSTSSTALSWYASKLQHRPNVDSVEHCGLHPGSLGKHLPQQNTGPYEYYMDRQKGHRHGRHPLSPTRSSYSEDEHDDDDDDDDDDYSEETAHGCHRQHPVWGGMVNSSLSRRQHLTLPPLRGGESSSSSITMRLPPISSYNRYRSHSISFDHHSVLPPLDGSRVRRLSLADLDMPIHETKKVVDHSMNAQQAQFEGVDVSEDEIHALEAFGELWSQGREVEMEDLPPSFTSVSSSLPPLPPHCPRSSLARSFSSLPVSLLDVVKSEPALMQDIKREIEQVVPGMDTGRCSPRNKEDSKMILDMAMELD